MVIRNSGLARNLSKGFKRKKFGKPQIRPILLVVGILVLAGLLIILIPRLLKNQKGTPASFEDRVTRLEKKFGRIEAIEKRIAKIEARNTKMALSIMDRVDRMEKSIMFKMDQMGEKKGSVTIEPSTVVVPQEKPIDKPSPKKKQKRLHKVKAGETLYRISRTYGLSLNELRRLNKLGPNAVIYVGQELIIENTSPD
ncbi:MAG: LysM peptidoglycan-binding domain-containing protein [Deltaproteobacteria bacterium]|nr:LysM peptidoglycan-binding domain-containing protein [Deltaproteobacteria bacterium]